MVSFLNSYLVHKFVKKHNVHFLDFPVAFFFISISINEKPTADTFHSFSSCLMRNKIQTHISLLFSVYRNPTFYDSENSSFQANNANSVYKTWDWKSNRKTYQFKAFLILYHPQAHFSISNVIKTLNLFNFAQVCVCFMFKQPKLYVVKFSKLFISLSLWCNKQSWNSRSFKS